MSFQMKKPSAVLKHLSSIVEKNEAEDNTSTKLSLCELSSQKEQKKKGHNT